jgi:putative transposase
MDEFGSASHSWWDCKYHVIFIPKCRKKTLYAELRRHLRQVFRELVLHKESQILERHLRLDHVPGRLHECSCHAEELSAIGIR